MKKAKVILKENYFFILSFGVLFGSFVRWWLAFYPALMTADSLTHWKEASTFKLTNASPYLYSLLIFFLKNIYNSPAIISFFQLMLFAFIISLFLNYFLKKGIHRGVLWLVLVVYALWPQFGIYNVTIWKDVIYSFLALILGVYVYLFFVDDKITSRKRSFAIIALTSALIPLFRFNGLPFLVLPAIIFLVFKITSIKRVLALLFSTFLIYFFFNNILFSFLKVTPAPLMYEGLTVKTVGAIYHLDNPNLSDFERKSFQYLHSEENWKKRYDCQSVNYLFYSASEEKNFTVFSKAISDDPQIVTNWHKSVVTATLKNPQAYIKDRVCQATFLLGVKTNPFKYVLENATVAWAPAIPTSPKSNQLKFDLTNLIAWTVGSRLTNYIFWATWPIIFFSVIFGLLTIKKKFWGTFTYIFFMFVNLATTVMVVPAIDYRYVYFFYVCFPFVPILYLYEAKKSSRPL